SKGGVNMPELGGRDQQWVKIDGEIVRSGGDFAVTKAAIDPVWHLPGIAARFHISEDKLRRTLFEQTGGIYPELVTRPDLSVFLPPIGGITLYIFRDPAAPAEPQRSLTRRLPRQGNRSHVVGFGICPLRPPLPP